MKKSMKNAFSIGVVSAAALCIAMPANAGQDIKPTWNSSDKDVVADFHSYGDYFVAREYAGDGYLDIKGSNTGGGAIRWHVPGGDDKAKHRLTHNFKEGTSVGMNVCQFKRNWPDDCSNYKYGAA